MPEYVITLKGPDGTSTETVYNRETAYGIKDRWERLGEDYTAEIAEPVAVAA